MNLTFQWYFPLTSNYKNTTMKYFLNAISTHLASKKSTKQQSPQKLNSPSPTKQPTNPKNKLTNKRNKNNKTKTNAKITKVYFSTNTLNKVRVFKALHWISLIDFLICKQHYKPIVNN